MLLCQKQQASKACRWLSSLRSLLPGQALHATESTFVPDEHNRPHMPDCPTYSLLAGVTDYAMLQAQTTHDVLHFLQVTAKDTEITRLNNDVDSLGLELGRARGELAKQVGVLVCMALEKPCGMLGFGGFPADSCVLVFICLVNSPIPCGACRLQPRPAQSHSRGLMLGPGILHAVLLAEL